MYILYLLSLQQPTAADFPQFLIETMTYGAQLMQHESHLFPLSAPQIPFPLQLPYE